MKTRIILIILISAFVSQSCEDYLKEELVSDVAANQYFATPGGMEDAVRGIYRTLKEFFGQERGFTMTVFGTDVHTHGADGDHKTFDRYDGDLNSNQSYVKEAWRDFYAGINQANAVIGRINDVEGMSEDLKKLRKAEAHFLRAYYYFILVRTYGEVHLTLEETLGVEVTANKTAQKEIYEQAIIPDLQIAIADLADPSEVEQGRANKAAAEFLMAKVYMTMAYQPWGGGTTDAKVAEDMMSDVIDDYDFELATDFYELFGNNEEGVPVNIASAEDNAEIIFVVENDKAQVDEGLDDRGHRGHLYFLMEYDKLPSMQRDTENGRPWKRFRPTDFHLSLWDRTIDARYDQTYKHFWLANNEGAIPVWTQEEADAGYCDSSLVGKRKHELGEKALHIPGPGQDQLWDKDAKKRATFKVITREPAYDGDPWFYTEKMYPTLNKFIDNTRPNRQHTEGQRDFYLMRLGDAYLIRAEARLMQGNTGGAADDINVIRRRAAWDGMEAAMEITPADVTLDFILDERARELDGEGHRWWDLVRTGKLVERVRLYNLRGAPNIQEFHNVRPIPLTQIDATQGGYPQNPGYTK